MLYFTDAIPMNILCIDEQSYSDLFILIIHFLNNCHNVFKDYLHYMKWKDLTILQKKGSKCSYLSSLISTDTNLVDSKIPALSYLYRLCV